MPGQVTRELSTFGRWRARWAGGDTPPLSIELDGDGVSLMTDTHGVGTYVDLRQLSALARGEAEIVTKSS